MNAKKYFFILTIFSILIFTSSCTTLKGKITENRNARKLEKLKLNRPDLSYDSIIPIPVYENLVMLGKAERDGVHGQRNYGMILRCLRFQNITLKVEQKYALPPNFILAMIMQESGGIDMLPNSTDDGGVGLCHMQPSAANEFGLNTYQDCKDLINYEHGKALRKLIEDTNRNKIELIKFDDRFHPIINVDAAARMIVYYSKGKQFKETPLQTAIYRYAGKKNYKYYYSQIQLYMSRLNNEKLIEDVRKAFNEINPDFTIDGKKADFDDYINSHQQQNLNYGLKKYK